MSTVLNRVAVGEVGVLPGTVKMWTTENLATITTAGFLNGIGNQGTPNAVQPSDVIECLYSASESTGGGIFTFLAVSVSNGVVTLSATSGDDALTDAHIFVGNAANVATDVAMSGDATIANTGALTIANDAITTAKILNANVTLAKLASGIAPSHVIKFANQVTTVGGAASEAFTVTGALAASDMAFVQVVDNGTANVTVLEAVVTNDTLTVTFSADPGNDCVFNFQIIRAAS